MFFGELVCGSLMRSIGTLEAVWGQAGAKIYFRKFVQKLWTKPKKRGTL